MHFLDFCRYSRQMPNLEKYGWNWLTDKLRSSSRQSFERKTTTYEQEVEIKVEAQTDYLQEWEARIAEDLIRSTRVFILKDQWFREYDWGTGAVPGGGEINPTLIPVQILNSGVMEYNKNYEKLFQHSIEFTYQNISGYRTSL